MSKRRMVGWLPLAIENPTATNSAHTLPEAEESAVQAQTDPKQQPNVSRRRMVGWEPLTLSQHAAPVTPTAASTPSTRTTEPVETPTEVEPSHTTLTPGLPRRRMDGWQPLQEKHPAQISVPEQPDAPSEVAPELVTAPTPTPETVVVQEHDVSRRRMDGWQPLQVAHPEPISAPAMEDTSTSVPEPATPVQEQAPASKVEAAAQVAPEKPVLKRMGAAASAPSDDVQVQTPAVVTPAPQDEPAAAQEASQKPRKGVSRMAKVLIMLGLVAVVAAGVVLLAQWVRGLGPVAEFIATYDGTPSHPVGVEAGIPGWVGWQHFFNFFIIVMVLRSGLLIRNQERPEAYWTPKKKSFFSPSTKNTPAKVSIQQWIHQSFNVLWVVNGLFFYVMVFVTGHWMRLIPTNWDIFPNIVSASIQYVSLDWPEENSWVYYNALQMTTYFLTVFVAGPLAVLTGLRMSTWWPQNAPGMNKAFPLPVARKLHFGTMLYFVAFIIVHLFLVFTTGALRNLNMMFTARDDGDWWGIGVFAVSVAVTVGVAWLMKPIFISGLAEKTGTVSSR